MPSSMSLKWCKKNLEHFSQAAYDLLKEDFPDVEMEVVDCVDHCGLCTDVPFALRNNAIIGARDVRGLYEKLARGMSFFTEPPVPGTHAADLEASQQERAEGSSSENE